MINAMFDRPKSEKMKFYWWLSMNPTALEPKVGESVAAKKKQNKLFQSQIRSDGCWPVDPLNPLHNNPTVIRWSLIYNERNQVAGEWDSLVLVFSRAPRTVGKDRGSTRLLRMTFHEDLIGTRVEGRRHRRRRPSPSVPSLLFSVLRRWSTTRRAITTTTASLTIQVVYRFQRPAADRRPIRGRQTSQVTSCFDRRGSGCP